MATTTDRPTAEITIPARYVADMRAAIVHLIHDDGDALRADDPEARDPVRALRDEVLLLGELLDADGDVTLRGDRAALDDTLDELVRSVLAARLADEIKYGPVNMGALLDVAERLRWTADNATRINPGLYGDVLTVTLTREQRDALRDELEYISDGEGGDLHFTMSGKRADPSEARAVLRRLGIAVRLLDMLGWQEHGEDDEYTISVDSEIAELGAYIAERGRGLLEDDERGLEEARSAPPEEHQDPAKLEQLLARDRTLVEVGEMIAAAAAGTRPDEPAADPITGEQVLRGLARTITGYPDEQLPHLPADDPNREMVERVAANWVRTGGRA